MSSIFWISDSFRKHLAQKVHDLENDTYKMALVSSLATSPETVWAEGVQNVGDVVVPTTRNGHRYICIVGGGAYSEPPWPTLTDSTTRTSPMYAEYGGDMCAHDVWSDVSAAEVAEGAGYVAGGTTLLGGTLIQSYRDTSWTANDIDFLDLTKTFRYAFLYKSGTDNGVTNPIVGYQLCDTAFIDRVVNGINYKIEWSVNGVVKISKG